MSNFLNLNGIAVPCSVPAGADGSTDELGTSKRAIDGTMLIHRRVTKQKWNYTLTPQDDLHARAFRDLVLGKGEYFSFDATLYSSKGRAPTAAVNNTQSGAQPYLGAGNVFQTLGGGNLISYTVPEIVTRGQWSVIYGRRPSGVWTHYIATFDGSTRVEYTNAVSPGTSQAWLTVSTTTGLVTVASDAGANNHLDELVILPYLIPVDWVAQIYALNNGGTQWSALARLNATGTSIEGNSRPAPGVAVKGTASKLTFTPSTLAGASFAENNQTFAFMLEEV